VKAVAIYRDNCKVGQPLSTAKKDGESTSSVTGPTRSRRTGHSHRATQVGAGGRESESHHVTIQALRERMPRRRVSTTFAFRVADCEGYVTVGEYEDGRPVKSSSRSPSRFDIGRHHGRLLDLNKLGLQHGVPLATYVRKYVNMKFEPSGMTDDADLRIATSLVD